MKRTGLSFLVLLLWRGVAAAQAHPSDTYIVPVVAHTPGDRGSFFQSDLWVVNPLAGALEVTMYLLPGGADNTSYFASAKRLTLPARTIVFLPDVMQSQWRASGLASILLVGTGGDFADHRFIANSRTYNTSSASGTFGLAVAPSASPLAAGIPSMLAGLANNAAYRSNIGVFNDSGFPATALIRIFGADGGELASTSIQIPPFSLVQKPVRDFAPAFDAGYAIVTASGDPAMMSIAYGTVADNGTSDASYFESVPLVFENPVPPSRSDRR
jgi:hypothetical protein